MANMQYMLQRVQDNGALTEEVMLEKADMHLQNGMSREVVHVLNDMMSFMKKSGELVRNSAK